MKKLRYLAVLIIVAIAGFALGRATGTSGVPSIANIHRDFPLFPAPPKPTPAAPKIETPVKVESDIVLEEPPDGMRPEGVVFQVSGRAKTGGSPIRVTVSDAQGVQLFTQIVTVVAAAGEDYGRFSLSVTLPALPAAPVTLTVKRDGQEGVEAVERILVYGASDEIPVKVYFSRSDSDECGLVYPIERMVAGRIAIYRAALEELLKGPNADDVAAGYRTSIPGSVKLKSVAADANGTVTADFDDRLSRGVAGSCRIESIRAQIGATLKQFPEVHDVVISINGRTEGILEP
ncbi:MAG TPA: GerMN domain-containing protein [Candidatus Eisenbacteria bacterium]|nr:GerMN domain-containing protein [Candidatus Eisenbacteria bacterium]